ncbi:MAG TPA: UDP-3-O-(3-hydroxymyristoyl)glucosamine N-acyltransferase [Planctomycetota bacterium]|jgi:UDP-3-O-[3-hydroxymyristoyl] glucosamine N-acyltransferase
MSITLGELAAKIGASLVRGEAALLMDGVANLSDAGARELAPFTNAKFAGELERTRAGAVLAFDEKSAGSLPAGTALLVAADPEMALISAINLLHPMAEETVGVDPRAVVEPGAELGADVHLGPFAIVRSGARIGAGSHIMAHSVIGRNCVIGANCRVYPNVVLYDNVKVGERVILHAGVILGADGFGYKFRQGKHVKVPQVGTVEIGNDVEIGANTCIDRGALGPTRIGDGTKIDNLVQIGHGVRIGRHCILCGQSALAGSCTMEDYAVIGGNVGIADHIVLGKGARVGAKSGVSRDVPPGGEVFGLPAEERKAAFRQLAALRQLPELLGRIRELEKQLGARKK